MKEIAEGIFQLEGAGWIANAFLVGGDRPVVVDAGTPRSGRRIVAELADAGVVPVLILLTHSHFDHAGGAAAVREATGAQICAPAAERALLAGSARHKPLVRTAVRAANLGRSFSPPEIDRWLEAGDVVEGLELVATPGHTAGHASYRLGTTLFAGDAFMTGDRFREAVPVYIADRPESRRSIEKLAELGLDLALSGHGPPSHRAAEKLRTLVSTWR